MTRPTIRTTMAEMIGILSGIAVAIYAHTKLSNGYLETLSLPASAAMMLSFMAASSLCGLAVARLVRHSMNHLFKQTACRLAYRAWLRQERRRFRSFERRHIDLDFELGPKQPTRPLIGNRWWPL